MLHWNKTKLIAFGVLVPILTHTHKRHIYENIGKGVYPLLTPLETVNVNEISTESGYLHQRDEPWIFFGGPQHSIYYLGILY